LDEKSLTDRLSSADYHFSRKRGSFGDPFLGLGLTLCSSRLPINLKRGGDVYELDAENGPVFGQKKLNTSH
jgi:hypothetical protein